MEKPSSWSTVIGKILASVGKVCMKLYHKQVSETRNNRDISLFS